MSKRRTLTCARYIADKAAKARITGQGRRLNRAGCLWQDAARCSKFLQDQPRNPSFPSQARFVSRGTTSPTSIHKTLNDCSSCSDTLQVNRISRISAIKRLQACICHCLCGSSTRTAPAPKRVIAFVPAHLLN